MREGDNIPAPQVALRLNVFLLSAPTLPLFSLRWFQVDSHHFCFSIIVSIDFGSWNSTRNRKRATVSRLNEESLLAFHSSADHLYLGKCRRDLFILTNEIQSAHFLRLENVFVLRRRIEFKFFFSFFYHSNWNGSDVLPSVDKRDSLTLTQKSSLIEPCCISLRFYSIQERAPKILFHWQVQFLVELQLVGPNYPPVSVTLYLPFTTERWMFTR